jgi:hypothetical protein
MTQPHAVPALPDPDPYEGLPADWSESAKATYAAIEADNPGLSAANTAVLYEVCSLLSLADHLQERVEADGFTSTGSKGQPTPHPLIAEVRLCRASAITALTRAGLGPRSPRAAAGSALARERWSK